MAILLSDQFHPCDEDASSPDFVEHLSEDSALPSMLALSALVLLIALGMMGCSRENKTRRAYFDTHDAELTAQPVLMSEAVESENQP